ncbi:heterokaryon incompatibility protein-domain-containing protein [Fusarium venenatum]|uniref:heterokaryon incompatibility protein-domain-containing protein n=1 Tax=Fusarium venenatum TaxID=56646 RepID=UPI001DB27EBE|nr:heterokaryon incompatibility protein-domain-containing protein [Fusarium venenatum]
MIMDIPFEYKSFKYDALSSPTSIRLLRPIKRFQDAEQRSINGVPLMEFLLETSEHDRRPPYQALSYTWGNPKEAEFGLPQTESSDRYSIRHMYTIVVNGRLFYVRKNLYEALYRIQERMVEPNSIDDRCYAFNKTKLIQAAEDGNLHQVTESLDSGANHHCQDNFGETALHYAAENGYAEIVKLLLLRGASQNIRDSTGRDPLGCCLQRKRRQWQETAQILRSWDEQDIDRPNPTKPTTLTGQPLWIDAICISQDDIPERNSQVAMMSQIYGSAQSVLAWLGEVDDTTQLACNVLSSEMPGPEEYMYSFRRLNAYRRGEKLDLDEKPDGVILSVREFLAIRSLFTRLWFSRTWVIQEVSLAKQIDMMCGPFHFSWMKLFDLIFGRFGDNRTGMILSCGGPAIKFGRAVPGTEILSLFDIRIRTRPECKEAKARGRWVFEKLPKQKLSLSAMIILSWNFGVSDPRDRIFALLAISRPLKGISADYSKSTTEVFTDMARLLIQAEGDNSVPNWAHKVDDLEPLESLSLVQPPSSFTYQSTTISLNKPQHSRPLDLPSWVPMFNIQLVSWRIYNRKYNASRDRQAIFYPSLPGILKLDGLVVDTIAELEEPPLMTFYERLIHDNAIEKWLGIVSRLSAVYPTGESHVEALWRTIVQDKRDNEDTDVSKDRFKVILLQCIVEHRRRNSSDDHLSLCNVLDELRKGDSGNLLPSALDVMTSNEGLHDRTELGVERLSETSEQVFRSGMMNNLTERCLLRTEGGYLGVSSKVAQPKDCVVLLAGGRTPYILRPIGENQFMFIGEAYVHGMMFGETLEGQNHDFCTFEIK